MDRNEFANKVLKYKDNMFRFAYSYLKSSDEAKDVVQDVLLKLWETRYSLDDKKNMEAWCMTLTRNKSLDLMKSAGRKNTGSIDEVHQSPASYTDSPLETVAVKESMGHIESVLKEMPEKQVAVFRLRDMQGYSYIEIGEILGLSIDQVKVNIFRARKSLRQKLENVYSYGK